MRINEYEKFVFDFSFRSMFRRIRPKYDCFESPIMGWSSWNTYRVHINDTLIIRQADAMVQKGLKEVGYSYVNVDDGFFGWRDEKE